MKTDHAHFSAENIGDFELDLRIVEYGPVSAALLGNTDDGCDTSKDGDC